MEQNVILYATKKVPDASKLELLPGSAYRWEVPIEVSHDVAPYERMRYGRVFQKMSVHLEWCTKTWLLSKYKDVSVERDVWLTCVPRLSNMLDYAKTHRTMNEHLGPLVMHIRSHHLVVGGYLRLGLHLPSFNRNCKILRMDVSFIQATTLHSRKRSGVVYPATPADKITFLKVEEEEFTDKMQNLQAIWIARLPTCHQMRPSTQIGSTSAAIKVTHKLEVRLVFVPKGQPSGEKPITYSAMWPVTLPSVSVISAMISTRLRD